MNRRLFIASMIGGLVSFVTGKPNLEACKIVKVQPEEVESFEPRLLMVKAKDLKFGSWARPKGEFFDDLMASIKNIRVINPLLVGADFTIIDGTMRGLACQELDMNMLVPVMQVSMTSKEINELHMMTSRPTR